MRAPRGFAAYDATRRREIAAQGGRAAHRHGTAHQWTREEAAAAGRKGGALSRGGRGRLPAPTESPRRPRSGDPSDAFIRPEEDVPLPFERPAG